MYLIESSVDEDELTHLTHARELHRTDPRHQNLAPDLIEQFHRLRQGYPSTVTASHKHDGGASILIRQGAVTDKHRFKRNEWASTPEEVDKYFGHAPAYAEALKHILRHSVNLVNSGRTVQGDLLFTPGDRNTSRIGSRARYKPNRITYEAQTSAPVGVALHHEITNRVAHGITPGAINNIRGVFVPKHEYTPDPKTYAQEDRDAVEAHLSAARSLLQQHTTKHLTPDHIGIDGKPGYFSIYMNSTVREGTKPSVRGYMKYLQTRGKLESSALKTPAGQQRRMSYYTGLMQHVKANAEHFQRTIDIEHHLNLATEHVLRGISHPDIKAGIDGAPEPAGEGIVLSQEDKHGRSRPLLKLVRRSVSKELLSPVHRQQRFGK